MTEIQGIAEPGQTLIERYDFLAALIGQLHRHAAYGLAGITSEREALEAVLADTTIPCCARVDVLRSKNKLINLIQELRKGGEMVSARFKVSRITPMGAETVEDAWATEVEMTPDYAGGANAAWAEATPQGVFRMLITNKAALEQLPMGASLEILIKQLDNEPATTA